MSLRAYADADVPLAKSSGGLRRVLSAQLAAASAGIVATGAVAVPALASGGSGGSGLTGLSSHNSNAQMGVVQSGQGSDSASGNGVTITTPVSGFLSQGLRFNGTIPHSPAGTVVEIERMGRETGGRWRPTVHGTARRNGSFSIVWNTNHIGRFSFRAVVEARRTGRVAAVSPSVQSTIFRWSVATQYGPGFYGSTTACGEQLTSHTLGVANRTLPCGTPVDVYWQGRTIVVPVIDRGPYANGADWDLTEATGRKLGISGTATIGAVSLPRH